MTEAESAGDLFRVLFNAVPLPLFRVTRGVEILDLNLAAQRLFSTAPGQALRKRSGEVLHCINAEGNPGRCGEADSCTDCLIRNSVREVLDTGSEISRLRAKLLVRNGDTIADQELLLTVSPIVFAGEKSALLCLEDISELTSLRALIPICSSCKKIRDDQQLWSSVESYFARYHGVDFTHGICPDCARRLYPDFYPEGKH